MLIGLTDPLTESVLFPMTLIFADRNNVAIEVWVQNNQEGSEAVDGITITDGCFAPS